MRIRTILNKVYKHKSFVYTNERLETIDGRDCLVIDVEPRKNSKPICSGCGISGSIYDHQSQARRFEFIPMWGIVVYLCYQMRRVTCKACGVKVEQVPWAEGKNQLTTAYQIFLAQWARRLSWKEVADVFNNIVLLAMKLDIDLLSVAKEKLLLTEEKYPTHKWKGRFRQV